MDLLEELETSPPPEKKQRRSAATAAAAAVAAAAVAEQNDMKDFQVPKSSRSSTRSQALQRGRAFARAHVPPIHVPKPVTSPSAPALALSQKSEINNKQPGEEWNTEDLSKLIENLIFILPKADSVKYSTQVDRIDWNKVCFDSHTAEECKDKWGTVMTKLRRYRTLTELVLDAKEWVKHPWMTYNNAKGKPKHPDLPKKPLTPYFRYFLEKREKYSQENPELSMTELAKLLAKKFAELPEKKKQKYKECYEKENEVYKSQLEKFKEEHPDMFPDVEVKVRQPSKQNGPQKPQTPVQLFIADKMEKHMDVVGSNRKELEEKYKTQWRNLTDSKRVRWIKKAMADEQRYVAEVAEYCILHPDYKPDQVKSVISKAEKGIKDRSDGKPERPPNSGYGLYSKIMLKELKDIPSKEKMGEISRRWKELPERDRQTYARQATELMERYQQDYKLYISNLSEDERKKLEEENKKKKKPAGGVPSAALGGANVYASKQNVDHPVELPPSRPKKPMSALFFYQQEKLAQYKVKNPEKSEQELTRLIAREYGELSEKKKEKYKKMAEEAKKSYEQSATSKENEVKNKAFKGEPKKPPQSGYSLFTSELMSKLTDIEPKYRMAEISKRWGALPNNEKEKYKRRATEQQKKYSKELQKFLLTLTEDERKVYQQMKAKKPIRRKAAANKGRAEAPSSSSSEESSKEDNKEESSSSESGSGSSGSSSENEETDSDSESGSESESKSEGSGSGKDSDAEPETKAEKENGSGNSSSEESDSQSESGSASESESEEEE